MDLSAYFARPAHLPDGYPLAAIDANGRALHEGQHVRIDAMPTSLLHDLPGEDVARLRALEGTPLPILGFDAYGHVWFGDGTPWFSVRPDEVIAHTDEDAR
jgi:hypothetical protein